MTETKSCLNCLHGKTEKQEQGYYCKLPAWDYAANRFDSYPCWHYKPRPNRCEVDGCKWFGEHEVKDFCYYDDDYKVGKTCDYFEKKEAEMEQIEFQGKKYERTGQVLTLYTLFNDARGCSDITHAVWLFSKKHNWFDYHADITMSKRVVMWIKSKPGIIPWLVEHDYLKEVVEEETYYGCGQFFKWEGGIIMLAAMGPGQKVVMVHVDSSKGYIAGAWHSEIMSVQDRNKVSLSEMKKHYHNFEINYAPISPPTITEQPEPAERRPEKCVHNRDPNSKHRWRFCEYGPAIKADGEGGDYIYCQDNTFKTCPEYSVIFNLNKGE